MKLLSQADRTTLIAYVLQSLPLYSFSCFKVPDHVCNKMDSIVCAFWLGHEHGEKKLHLLNWDRISQPKGRGGLGIKKFKYMNQAMLNKQYWRICQNPQSLLAKTFKARYIPTCSIHDYRSKPHHSWVWRNIMKQENHVLREGKWRVGDGYIVPLNHRYWFPHSTLNLSQHHLPTGTVGDLIDHNTRSWKVDLVGRSYPFSQALKIFQIPISKTNFVQDKLFWRFSKNGEYQVKKAYKLLTRDDASHPRYFYAKMGWWRTFWKIKVPLKISTFIWKLLHNCLPTFLHLHARGISSTKLCPLCNEEEESHTHIFLHCPFVRACWHGSTLALCTSEFINLFVQQWLKHLLSRDIQNGSDTMNFLQDIFVTLWTI